MGKKESGASRVMKSGKVVVLLNGRFAGRKAVLVKPFEGTDEHKFGHAIVAGIARQPRKVTKAMTKKQINRRSTLKTFVKRVNYAHMMPTRYSSDLDLKRLIDETQLDNPAKRKEMRLGVKKVFEERYRNQTEAKSEKAFTGNAFLFKRLRF